MSSTRAGCTIIARNYLAQARVLARSFLEHVPDSRFFVLAVDGWPEGIELEPGVIPVGPEDLGVNDFVERAFKYDVTELCTALKPALLSSILAGHGVDELVYLDPDMVVFRPLNELWELMSRSTVVLVPHLLDPIPMDGHRPSEQDILTAGAYNLGFIGVRASDETERMLAWWDERLQDHCRVDVAHGLFVDQKWVDLVPSLYPGTSILRESTYDVAYWNLHSRCLRHGVDGVQVDGRPLAVFHYSGFDPAQPRTLSKHQDRIEIEEGSALAFLLDSYVDAVQRCGFALTRTWPYGYATFDNGFGISRLHRHLYADVPPDRRHAFGNPFATASADSFFSWASRFPDEGTLSPLLEQLLSESEDARVAFPHARGKQRKAFLTWAQTYASKGFGFDSRLVEGEPDRMRARGNRRDLFADVAGVNVIGYLKNETGIGAVARCFVGALRAAGVPFALKDVSGLSPNRSEDPTLQNIDEMAPYRVNLVCVNADQHFVVKSYLGDYHFDDHYNIGVWFWELPSFPDEWLDRFNEYDEIWAPSSFIANALSAVSPIPIVHMTPVLFNPQPGSREAGRAHIGVDDDTVVFLQVFDFASYFERKNPLATIRAFRHAFAPQDKARLVLKCVNEHLDPGAFARMKALAEGWPVAIHTSYWSSQEMRDLMAACDAYVSLHRSEGLGLPLADAMALGKPVIATGWSGNTDFMAASNSFLVPYEFVEVQQDAGPYRRGAIWADPCIEDAATLMRLVFDDRQQAQARAAVGRRDIELQFSQKPVSERVHRRLASVMQNRSRHVARASVPQTVEAPTVPAMELADSSHGRLGVVAKRGMNFLLRYHTHYQDEINHVFANFMRHLAQEQSRHAEELARLNHYLSARPYMAHDAYGAAGDVTQPMGFGLNATAPEPAPDFADLFRGPEGFIANRQRLYLQFLRREWDVVDLGSGRGEFLEILREQGMDAVGVELDRALVERCRARGLRVELADAFTYLEGLNESSVDAVFSAQFIEHVPSERVGELLTLARSRLRAGGLFIAETVNPESFLAMKTFYVDLSHQRPIFPQVLLYLSQVAGYRQARIFYPTAGGFSQTAYRDAGEYAIIALK